MKGAASRFPRLGRPLLRFVPGSSERSAVLARARCSLQAKAGAPRDYGFWPGVHSSRRAEAGVHSSRRAERASSRRSSGDRAAMAGNASGRTSFSPARSCAAVHGTAMCVLLTLISMGCSLDSPAKAPPFDPVTRRIDSTLAGESLRHKGADYATRRRELPTFVWSVVPPGLDSPAPADQPPTRSVAPPARHAAGPPEAGRRAAASRRKEHLRPGLAKGRLGTGLFGQCWPLAPCLAARVMGAWAVGAVRSTTIPRLEVSL